MTPPDPSVGSSDQPEQLPLRTNIIWSSTGSLTKTMCNWLITIAAVRLSSGFDTAGVLALAMSISNLVVPIAEYRLRTVQVTDVRGEHTARQYLGMRVLSSAAAMIIGAVYTLVTSKLSLFLVITVYCASQVIATFLEGFHATEQRHMRMDYIGISYLLQGGGDAAPLPTGSRPGKGTTRPQSQRKGAIPVEPVPAVAGKAKHPADAGPAVAHPVGAVKKAALAGEPSAACVEKNKREDTHTGDRHDCRDHCQPHAQNIASTPVHDEPGHSQEMCELSRPAVKSPRQ